MRRRLRDMQIPDHEAGFWASVDIALDQAAADEAESEFATVVPLESTSRHERFAPWMAAVAGAAVVLAFGAVTALVFRAGVSDDLAATTLVPASTTVPPATVASATTTTAATTTLSRSPWSSGPAASSLAPGELVAAWEIGENHEWCSALVPTDLGDAGLEAVPRSARFEGGWGVAWDLPDGPGQTVAGEDCPDCGRSAFGVAGTGEISTASTGRGRPNTIAWSDGSFAGYGADPASPTSTRRVADVVVEGQGCTYEVWSNLGDAHLIELIQGLRLVEGMTADHVEMRRPGESPRVVESDVPPWKDKVLPIGQVGDMVVSQWDALGFDMPQLVIADVGADLADARLRVWDSGVAWDADDGPGHDASNRPCADCGRGAVGLGWQPAGGPVEVDGVSLPYRIQWSDGSYAEYGGRLANPAIPRDRVVFFDPQTGEQIVDALQAIVHVTGFEQDVIIWTHLGEDHLLYLIDQLRIVDLR